MVILAAPPFMLLSMMRRPSLIAGVRLGTPMRAGFEL